MRFLGKILLFPAFLLLKLCSPILKPTSARVDASPQLSNFINQVSSSMATQRGLLLMLGTVLLVVSLVTHGLVIILMVSTASFTRNLYWLCLPVTLLHLGILVGFTGTMLATPLGQGYKDK
jgi:hypothetical protein